MKILTEERCTVCGSQLETRKSDTHASVGIVDTVLIVRGVVPCEACLESAAHDAVEAYKSDQIAMSIDKVRDESRDG